MTAEDEKQKIARSAYKGFVSDVSVFLIYENTGVGSGIVFRSSDGRPVVLTARHVAEDVRGALQIGTPSGRDAQRVRKFEILLAPMRPVDLIADGREKEIDVAAVRFPADSWSLFSSASCDSDHLASDEFVDAKEDVALLTGYPVFLAVRKAPTENALTHIVYTTGVRGKDPYGRLSVEWGEAVADVGAPEHPVFPLNVREPRTLGPPNGISGGGLWRIRGTSDKSEIWSPTRFSRLLGVPCAWDRKRTQFVEPVSLWANWFKAVLDD